MNIWSERNWSLALKTQNPMESFREFQSAIEREDNSINIDELPNKDWLRQT